MLRFEVSREDVDVLLAELRNDHPEALYAPLLEALLAAAATLDVRGRGPQRVRHGRPTF